MSMRRLLVSLVRPLLVGACSVALLLWLAGVFSSAPETAHRALVSSATAPPAAARPSEASVARSSKRIRPMPRPSYGMALQDAIDAPGPSPFADRCRDVLSLVGGLSTKAFRSFCALAPRFDGLMRVRYARPEMSEVERESLCGQARADLASANAIQAGSNECGEISGAVLAWTDEAWLAGCVDTRQWSDAYRAFLVKSSAWQPHDTVCRSTASTWSSLDEVESPPSLADPDERWEAAVAALGWTQSKLCSAPILDRLRAEQATGAAPLLFIDDPDMAALARACMEGGADWSLAQFF